MITRFIIICLLAGGIPTHVVSAELKVYKPSRVIYDLSSSNGTDLKHILDRASLLQNLYGSDSFDASIVIVVHEGAIPLFRKKGAGASKELMRRANSLTMGDIIQFKLCRASARMQGFKADDFHDFVVMVPMADAEIVQLQQEGYAYLR